MGWRSCVVGLLLAACAATDPGASPPTRAPPTTAAAPPDGGVIAATVPAPPSLRVLAVRIRYGLTEIRTAPDARCSALLRITRGRVGDAPPSLLPEQAATSEGFVTWAYPAPRIPAGPAVVDVRCVAPGAAGSLSERFEVPARPIVATDLTVRVTAEDPPAVAARTDARLVALRDASVAKMKERLADDWRIATRGLGSLRIVEGSADITIFVVAAAGMSVNRQPTDGSQDIVVYVSDDELGPQTVENINATALHELGHIWCCYGPGTFPAGTAEQGHWLTLERDPRLYGVDKYGLMTAKVTCSRYGSVLSCPNRFSDREMVALGFRDFPAPIPDPCIARALALKPQLEAYQAQLASMKVEIDDMKARLAELDRQIRAIEAQYPSGAPPSVVTTYRALIAEYNALASAHDRRAAEYNALVATARDLAAQAAALPCDPS